MKCNKCRTILILNNNWRYCDMKISNYQCKDCNKQYGAKRHIENRDMLLDKCKKYRQTTRGKIANRKATKKYRHKNIIKCRKNRANYKKTEIGKLAVSKAYAKRNRKLNFISMFDNPFDESENVEWHHITDAYVVAIPFVLHRLHYGKYHREMTMDVVKQVYLRG